MTIERWEYEQQEREAIQLESAAASASSAELPDLSPPQKENIPRQWALFGQPPREEQLS